MNGKDKKQKEKKGPLVAVGLINGTKGCYWSRLPDPRLKVSAFSPGLTFSVGKSGLKPVPNRNNMRVLY